MHDADASRKESGSCSEEEILALLKRMCKALSKKLNVEVRLSVFSKGETCLISDDNEVLAVDSGNESSLYHVNAERLLNMMLSKNTVVRAHPINTHMTMVQASCAMFGNTIDELKVNLDVMAVQS